MSGSGDTTRRAGHTRDARGKSVKLLDPVPLYMLGRSDVIERDSLESVMMELDPTLATTGAKRIRRRLVIIIGSAIVVLAVIGQIAIVATGDKNALRTLMKPYFFLPMIVGMVLPFIIIRAERMKKLTRVMLGHGLCPHCGYDLRNGSIEEDGATVCSECGSAWNLAEVEAREVVTLPDGERASNRRFKILLIAGLIAFALLVVSFLIVEFNN